MADTDTAVIDAPQGDVEAPLSLLSGLNIVTERDAPKEAQKPSDALPETKDEPPKPAEAPIEIPQGLTGRARDNFKKLEEAKREELSKRDQRIKELEESLQKKDDEWSSKYGEVEKKTKEYEARLSQIGDPQDFQRQIQERDQRLQELQNEYKLVALERDPEFVAAFDKPRQLIQEGLKDLSLGVGVSEQDFQRAIRTGDQALLEEIRDILPPQQQRQWDARLLEMERIATQRDVALRDKEGTYQQIIKQREEQYRQQHQTRLQEDISLARRLSEEPFEKIEIIKDDAELKGQVRQTLEALAGGQGAENWTKEKVLQQVASSIVMQKILGTQNQIIEAARKDVESKEMALADKDKKIKELEDYIQKKHGSLPSNEVNGSTKPTAPAFSLKDIRVITR